MTEQEYALLDTLPEVEDVALYQDPQDFLLCEDRTGKAFATGWLQGRHGKMRRPHYDRLSPATETAGG